MAEASGRAPTVSMSLFLEMSDLEIEAGTACMATLCWAEAVWMGRWTEDLEKCWRRVGEGCVWEAASRKQVRGPAGAVVCETRDCPRWHALLFEEGVIVVMKGT